MSDVQWEDPPVDGRSQRSGAFADAKFAEALRSRPGEWAYYGERESSAVTKIRQGKVNAFYPRGHYDATSRKIPDSVPVKYKVWARYVGPEGGQSP